MIGLFLGAGFSKWAADLPLVNQLFDFEISSIRANDEKWLNKLKSCKETWDLKNNGEKNDEAFISHVISKEGKNLSKYLIKYISRRLSEPYLVRVYGGSIQTVMIDDLNIKNYSGVSNAKIFLENIGTENIYGIITTNYDLLIEFALGTKKIRYSNDETELSGMGRNRTFPWQGRPIFATGSIKLAKIHGSISYDGKNYWTTGKCGLNGRAAILPPSPEKTRDERFKNEWEIAEDILKNVDQLIVFGFNFNEYDQAVLELIKTNSSSIKKILIYDVESKMTKAQKLWDKSKISEIHSNEIK